jgi:hypothetical protein
MWEYFKKKMIEIGNKHPQLKGTINELYSLAKSEVEEGGSPENEIELAYNSLKEHAAEIGIKLEI